MPGNAIRPSPLAKLARVVAFYGASQSLRRDVAWMPLSVPDFGVSNILMDTTIVYAIMPTYIHQIIRHNPPPKLRASVPWGRLRPRRRRRRRRLLRPPMLGTSPMCGDPRRADCHNACACGQQCGDRCTHARTVRGSSAGVSRQPGLSQCSEADPARVSRRNLECFSVHIRMCTL